MINVLPNDSSNSYFLIHNHEASFAFLQTELKYLVDIQTEWWSN